MRRSLLTPALQAKLASRIADGATLVTAARSVGIHRDTLFAWLGRFPDFSDAVRNAQEQASRLSAAAYIDARLRDSASRIERMQRVFDCWRDGLSMKDTEERLSLPHVTLWRWRQILGLVEDGPRSRIAVIEGATKTLALAREVDAAYRAGFRSAGDGSIDAMARVLGLEKAKGNALKRTGRRDSKAKLMEVRP